MTGGERGLGDWGGMDPQDPKLDPAESTFGIVLVVGVHGGGTAADESESLLVSCLGEADSSRLHR